MIKYDKNSDKNQKTDFNNFVFEMIKELSERSADVVQKRFNLKGEGVKTLEEIGRKYNITRERVRQIESESVERLKQIGKKHNIDLVFNNIKKIIDKSGGVISEEEITKHLFKSENRDSINKQAVLLILSLDDKIKTAKETNAFKKIYFFEKESFARFSGVIETLEKYLLESGKNLSFEKIKNLLNDNNFSNLSEEAVKSYLSSSKIILQSVLGEWGHQKWPHINPKSVRDKAYLALNKNKNPLHFIAIANKISEIWKNEKKPNSQTVHNELIKDKRFVLIGRGIYALSEWGYKPGTVLDVLLEIFNETGREMSQSEIVEKVLKKRSVKENTIILNLQNRKYFEKLANKVYKFK
jgi:hypothetical protein